MIDMIKIIYIITFYSISFVIPFKEILENEEKDIATSLYLVNHEKGKCYMISFGWSIGTMTKYNNKLNIELNLLQSIINMNHGKT